MRTDSPQAQTTPVDKVVIPDENPESMKEQLITDIKTNMEEHGFLDRNAWLAQAGKLKEKELEVDGLGRVLLVEITGAARAAIQSQQSMGLIGDVKRIDVASYQRSLLLQGVADPTSPEGGRLPLFQAGDMDAVMKIGGGKIASVVEQIELLSGLGPAAVARAEENSNGSPSAAGTSG